MPAAQPGQWVITDPPFNIGFKYDGYGDRLPAEEYSLLLRTALRSPCVVIHYPEDSVWVARELALTPDKCVAWVYNSNTARQWRMVSWFGSVPDFSLVRQPYKNQSDRRIKKLMAAGSEGPAVYDWWEIDQVKNVSSEKTDHPCQMPTQLMAPIYLTRQYDT